MYQFENKIYYAQGLNHLKSINHFSTLKLTGQRIPPPGIPFQGKQVAACPLKTTPFLRSMNTGFLILLSSYVTYHAACATSFPKTLHLNFTIENIKFI